MAKPYKNSAEYFSHDADMRNDVKVKALRRRFGHTGYAVWNYLLEVLTDAEDFEIAYTPLNRELYAADFDIGVEKLDNILSYMESIGLVQRRDGVLYSAAHKARLQAVVDRREARAAAGRLGGIRSGEARRSKIEAKSKQNEAMLEANRSKTNQSKVKEKSMGVATPAAPAVPYEDIVALWNSICTSFPKVVKLSDARRSKIKSRYNEFEGTPSDRLQAIDALFRSVQASSFLRGDNRNGWQASFDWLFSNGQNWIKVMEGNYEDRTNGYNNGQDTKNQRRGYDVLATSAEDYGTSF